MAHSHAKVGIANRLAFEDMSHYTMVKTTTFNGIQHPAMHPGQGAEQLSLDLGEYTLNAEMVDRIRRWRGASIT